MFVRLMRYSNSLVPEIELEYYADLAQQEHAFPAYFVTDWAAGQGLARYVLDNGDIVRGKAVLDFGTGAGIVALAAKLAGAARVIGLDRDWRAVQALERNAATLGLDIETIVGDPLVSEIDFGAIDIILAGEVLYDDAGPSVVWTWLCAQARMGRLVLAGDSGLLKIHLRGLREVWRISPGGERIAVVYMLDLEMIDGH